MILETPSRESPKKRLRLTEVSNEQNIPEQLSIERSPEKSLTVASQVFTRTTTQKYTAIACLDDFLTFKLKSVSSWNDPHKSQKHIRSIITRVASFYLSLANAEEVGMLESECPAPGTPEWQSWHRKRRECFKELETRVENKIKSEEIILGVTKVPKEFSNSVSALDKRLGNIKWQPQVQQVYNEHDSMKFKDYFQK